MSLYTVRTSIIQTAVYCRWYQLIVSTRRENFVGLGCNAHHEGWPVLMKTPIFYALACPLKLASICFVHCVAVVDGLKTRAHICWFIGFNVFTVKTLQHLVCQSKISFLPLFIYCCISDPSRSGVTGFFLLLIVV